MTDRTQNRPDGSAQANVRARLRDVYQRAEDAATETRERGGSQDERNAARRRAYGGGRDDS